MPQIPEVLRPDTGPQSPILPPTEGVKVELVRPTILGTIQFGSGATGGSGLRQVTETAGETFNSFKNSSDKPSSRDSKRYSRSRGRGSRRSRCTRCNRRHDASIGKADRCGTQEVSLISVSLE